MTWKIRESNQTNIEIYSKRSHRQNQNKKKIVGTSTLIINQNSEIK